MTRFASARDAGDHVADFGREAGAANDQMRKYISAVMADWPARPALSRN